MSIKDDFSKLIDERKKLNVDIDYEHNLIITHMVNLLTFDIDETLNFITNDCTAEQLVWLSEILDEIMEKTRDPRILDAIREVAEKNPDVSEQYNIDYFINSAAEYL
jgi:hypothetical protein